MWMPILITVLAASGNNIGKVLQKQATRTLPRLVLQGPVLAQYFANTTWLVGMAADLGGALLMIVAFANAPVSVVQPVSAVGLVVLLIFSHFYLKERLKPREWASALVTFLGVLGLGASAEPDHLDPPDHLHPLRIILSFGAMVALLGLECWWRHGPAASGGGAGSHQQHHHHHHHHHHGQHHAMSRSGASSSSTSSLLNAPAGSKAAAVDAMLCGLEGGACFGFSAAACRTGFILARRLSWVWAPVGLLGSIMLTSSGFVLQTRGFKAGNTVVVCTMAAVASMISGVVAGLVALGEKMPTSHHMRLARLLSWVAILLGVSSLAGGADGLAAAARAVAALLVTYGPSSMPPWLWRLLPRSVSQALHKVHKKLAAVAAQDEVLPLATQHQHQHQQGDGGIGSSSSGPGAMMMMGSSSAAGAAAGLGMVNGGGFLAKESNATSSSTSAALASGGAAQADFLLQANGNSYGHHHHQYSSSSAAGQGQGQGAQWAPPPVP